MTDAQRKTWTIQAQVGKLITISRYTNRRNEKAWTRCKNLTLSEQ